MTVAQKARSYPPPYVNGLVRVHCADLARALHAPEDTPWETLLEMVRQLVEDES